MVEGAARDAGADKGAGIVAVIGDHRAGAEIIDGGERAGGDLRAGVQAGDGRDVLRREPVLVRRIGEQAHHELGLDGAEAAFMHLDDGIAALRHLLHRVGEHRPDHPLGVILRAEGGRDARHLPAGEAARR